MVKHLCLTKQSGLILWERMWEFKNSMHNCNNDIDFLSKLLIVCKNEAALHLISEDGREEKARANQQR